MNQKNISILTTDTNESTGGIQKWMHYVHLGCKHNGYNSNSYSYKKLTIKSYLFFFKSDLLMFSTWKVALLFIPLLIFSNKKIIIFVHGNEIFKINIFLKLFFQYLVKRRNTYFVANSFNIGNQFAKLHKRNIDFVQHPFFSANLSSLQKKCKKLFKKNRFITVSRLVRRKNIVNVLDAFSYLKCKDFQFLYFIVGEGPEYTNIKNRINYLNLDKNAFLLGHLNELKKDILLRNSDFFIMPSIFDIKDSSIEGYGISFIEANSFGIPVISGDTGGMIESVVNGITGIHSDGTVNNLIQIIKKITTTNFDTNRIVSHALDHDYRRQHAFYDFIQKILDCKHS